MSPMPAIDTSAATARFAFPGQDLPWLLRHWAAKKPEHPFLIWEPRSGQARIWSYAEFEQEVRRVAAGLLARGVQRQERVLIHCDNCPEAVFAWYACAWIGAVAVTSNTRSAGDEIRYFAQHARAVGAVTQPRYAALVQRSAGALRWIAVTADNSAEAPEGSEADHGLEAFDDLTSHGTAPERAPEPMLPAGIQFTSGTTARPKAVVHTHANGLWGGAAASSNLRMGGDDVYLVFLPFFHVNAQSWCIWNTLWAGGTVVLMPKFSASRFWEISLRHRCTRASMIPFCFKAIGSQQVPEHSYRNWVTGIILPELEEWFKVRTFACWGMTETVTHATRSDLHQESPRMSIGKPVPGYQFAVVDRESGAFCEQDQVGGLFVRGVRGVQLFLEYADNPEANAKSFDADGWFDTGDTISVGADGHLFFADRDKDILKVGGENVSAQQVEQVCMEAGGLDEVAVVAKPDEMLDEVPVLFAIRAADAEPEAILAEKVLARCRAVLADFKVPAEVHFVEEFPRSTLEKIAKNKLREQLQKD